jgi:uncharacterized membrane protein YphA (DoxX/SURF4 family)
METVILNPAKVNRVKNILRCTFGILPVITGIDKFFDVLVDWDKYLTPLVKYIPFSPHTFMLVVGVIEIIAGIIVLIIPRTGAYIVAIWLLCIVIVLVWGRYYDIAARDLVMAVSAFCLGELYSFKQKENNEKALV